MPDQLAFYIERYFLVYLVKQHNYGGNTISSYRDTFRVLLTYLKGCGIDISNLKVDELDHDIITSFLNWLQESRKNGVSTRNVRLAHIKSFYRYLLVNAPEHSERCSKILAIPFAKGEKKPPVCFSKDAMKSLLSSIDSSTRDGLRHLSLLALMYDSGCRVQEIIDLNVSDFQAGRCSRLYVKGKGNKYRTIPLLGETEKIISRYIQTYQLSSDAPLFSNKSGNRLTRQGIRHILRKYSELVNEESPHLIEGAVHPHRLRHSKATHLVDAGVNIYNVRDFLGHESVATTQIYLTSNPESTRKAIESVAENTVPSSKDYYSNKDKNDLLSFLDSLS